MDEKIKYLFESIGGITTLKRIDGDSIRGLPVIHSTDPVRIMEYAAFQILLDHTGDRKLSKLYCHEIAARFIGLRRKRFCFNSEEIDAAISLIDVLDEPYCFYAD